MSQTQNAAIAVVGIDIGKNSFHIVGHDERPSSRYGSCGTHDGKTGVNSIPGSWDGRTG